jgi:hypothetical protein
MDHQQRKTGDWPSSSNAASPLISSSTTTPERIFIWRTLEDETLEQVLSAISFTSPIKYAVDNKTVYIMADGQKMDKFKKLLME